MGDLPRRRGVASFGGELRGVAFVAVLALAAAGTAHTYYFGHFGIDSFPNYVPAATVLICLLFSYGKYARAALVTCFLTSLLVSAAYLFANSGGNSLTDVGEVAAREFHRYSYLSEWLFAFGSCISLVVSVILLCTHWSRGKQ
jgi:hypothetical protein